jgi:hypothetical protein
VRRRQNPLQCLGAGGGRRSVRGQQHYTLHIQEARTSTTSKAVKPVERFRERPTVPGSEGIDGANGGGDSAPQPSLKRPRPAGDRDPEGPFCFGDTVATRRIATRRVFLPGGFNVCFSTTTSRWRSFLPTQQQSVPLGTYKSVALAHDRKGRHFVVRTYTWHLPAIATGRAFCG